MIKYDYSGSVNHVDSTKKLDRNVLHLECSEKTLEKYPILMDIEFLDVKYNVRNININMITRPVLELAQKKLKNGWLEEKVSKWNKHFMRLEKAADEKVGKNKDKTCDVRARIYDEKIRNDRQYKLWRLYWDYIHRPCLLIVNYKDDTSKLLAEVSKHHIPDIHPGLGIELLIEAYHEYYTFDDTSKCPICHRKVLQTGGQGRKRIYDSGACKKTAYRWRKRSNVHLIKTPLMVLY